MAKSIKTVRMTIPGIGMDAASTGACVTKVIRTGSKLQITSIEIGMGAITVKSELESAEVLSAWASRLQDELRDFVNVADFSSTHDGSLPRSAEG